VEGYNPTHDICRIVGELAAERVADRGRTIPLYDYAVTERFEARGNRARSSSI
jgi:hypothetical protein